MSKNKPPYNSVQELPRFGPSLSSYLAKAQSLEKLTQRLQTFLSGPYQGQCRVANLRGDTLVIQVLNTALVTRLQYELPQLRDKMRSIGLNIQHIKLIHQPESTPAAKPQRRARHPGQQASTSLRACERSIDDAELKAAIAKLATNLDKFRTS